MLQACCQADWKRRDRFVVWNWATRASMAITELSNTPEGRTPDVNAVILKCLAKSQPDRYQSAVELRDASCKLAIAPVTGLNSNVGEWMRSWGNLPPESPIVNPEAPMQRVVRGAPYNVLEGAGELENPFHDPRTPTFQYAKVQKPGLGLRCVRSARPRLTAERFSSRPGQD